MSGPVALGTATGPDARRTGVLHQPTCADELSHAPRKYDEDAGGVEFDLGRFTEDVID